jgi:hypothetical protein
MSSNEQHPKHMTRTAAVETRLSDEDEGEAP